jgi:hypothetical protein
MTGTAGRLRFSRTVSYTLTVTLTSSPRQTVSVYWGTRLGAGLLGG